MHYKKRAVPLVVLPFYFTKKPRIAGLPVLQGVIGEQIIYRAECR